MQQQQNSQQSGGGPAHGLDALLAHLNGAGGAAGGGLRGAPGSGVQEASGDALLRPAASAPAARALSSRPTRAASEPRPTNSYNARHQQAEARRRSRINERLEALRQLVPHTERANTANFLEELVAYVQRMQARMADLERQLGLAPSVAPVARPITFSDDTAPEQTMTMHTAQGNDRRATQSLLGLPLPLPPSQPLLALPLPVPSMQPPGSDPAVQAALAAALLQHHQQQAAQQVQQAQLQQLLLNHHQAAAAAAVVAGQQPSAHMHMDMRLQPPQTQAASTPAPALPGAAAQQPSGGTAHPAGGSGSTKRNAGAAAAQSSGSLPGDSAGLQALAAADSLGALSVGDGGSLRSVSVPSKYPPVAEGARKQQEQADPFGIPTDEELASLHDHLTQDTKRRRTEGA